MIIDQTLPLLRQIGRYQILREVGRGTMGVVYEVFDPKLERTVALKTVRFEAHDPEHAEFEERFQREAKSAARLNHPNIVTIHDAGEEDDGLAYIAMEFLEGKSLREVMDSGTPLNTDDILSYAIQMAEALDYAHRFDIVHRDIKPGNIVISSQGRLKISDFGIAQLPSGNLTQAGTILGTPKYMSPEQVRGERLDGRSDIFSLGVILYEMFAGKAPFNGDSLASIMYQIMHGLPADPTVVNPVCPPGIRQIVARALAKDKLKRYPQAGEMAADLRKHQEIAPDPALMAAIFCSVGDAAESPSPSTLEADKTQPLALPPDPEAPTLSGKTQKLKWLTALGVTATLLAALAIWKIYPQPVNPQNIPASQVPISNQRNAAAPDSSTKADTKTSDKKKSASKSTTATKSEAAPKKGFWRRQVDCFKHGNCEKPVQPDTPPGFSP